MCQLNNNKALQTLLISRMITIILNVFVIVLAKFLFAKFLFSVYIVNSSVFPMCYHI